MDPFESYVLLPVIFLFLLYTFIQHTKEKRAYKKENPIAPLPEKFQEALSYRQLFYLCLASSSLVLFYVLFQDSLETKLPVQDYYGLFITIFSVVVGMIMVHNNKHLKTHALKEHFRAVTYIVTIIIVALSTILIYPLF